MGTTYTVKLAVVQLDAEAERGVRGTITSALEAVDSSMSSWREDSELGAFNQWGAGPFAASAELLEVIAHALSVSRASGGAFDITAAPLIREWGFGPWAGVEPMPPSPATIDTLLTQIGWQRLEVDLDAGTLRKTRPELQIDLSAIAKGYAVDRVLEGLEGLGFDDLMVEIGGEVRTAGLNTEGEPWRIGIENPIAGERGVRLVVPLSGRALATSGDYRNFYEAQGELRSHIIDPRTGRPVEHQLASVSVVADSCMDADAWATALSVLGPVHGFGLAEKLGLAALFLVRDDDDFEERATTAFKRLAH